MDSSPDNLAQNVKNILSESVIDQQYRTLDIFFKWVTIFKNKCPKILEAQYINFIVEVNPYF